MLEPYPIRSKGAFFVRRLWIIGLVFLLFASPSLAANYEVSQDTALLAPGDTIFIDYLSDTGTGIGWFTIDVNSAGDTAGDAIHFSTRLNNADSVTTHDFRLEDSHEPYRETNADIDHIAILAPSSNTGDVNVWIRAKGDLRHAR